MNCTRIVFTQSKFFQTFLVCLFGFFTCVVAESSNLLQNLEAHYKTNPALTAEFTQKVKTTTSKKEHSSSGTLHLYNPGRIRWEVKEPDPQLMLSNGKTFWQYTPPFEPTDRGQVIVKKVNSIKTPVLEALLAGRFSSSNQMTVKPKGNRSFLLIPTKKSKINLKKAEITLHPTELKIHSITLDYLDGNHTVITLSNVVFSKELPLQLFEFKAPEQTDVVKAD